jgi:hypothetical protein
VRQQPACRRPAFAAAAGSARSLSLFFLSSNQWKQEQIDRYREK